jgi:DNA-binding transcriptional LysR family regulator
MAQLISRCAFLRDQPWLRRISRRAAVMNLNQIRYVVALIEELNFSRAARRCGVTQPSVSNSIVALEQELGGPLFSRKPKIQLTELGRALQANLAAIDQLAAETREVARRLTKQPTIGEPHDSP